MFPSLLVANSHNWQGGQIYIAPTVCTIDCLLEDRLKTQNHSRSQFCPRKRSKKNNKLKISVEYFFCG